jgi:hypothetical protein
MTDVPDADEHHRNILSLHNGFNYEYAGEEKWDLKNITNQEEFCLNKKIPYTRMVCRKK